MKKIVRVTYPTENGPNFEAVVVEYDGQSSQPPEPTRLRFGAHADFEVDTEGGSLAICVGPIDDG